ncbi:MAG: preprotein translocase subunit SecE [Candidatus Izemoplasmatales bacterium]|jgi:preprotein translocase SecE subunit|nr:preprotein translocase subunit SecE [Candidatus Izemoplasmatales bacterium]
MAEANKEKKAKLVKQAPKIERQPSKVMAILKKEYAFENWLLAIISPVLIINGVYVVMGKFGNADLNLGESGIKFIDFFFNTDLKRILTGTFLILVGTLVVIYLAIPILRPSIAEMKKVSWPTGKSLAINTGRVFLFLLFLMLVFTLYGFALDPLFRWLLSL